MRTTTTFALSPSGSRHYTTADLLLYHMNFEALANVTKSSGHDNGASHTQNDQLQQTLSDDAEIRRRVFP